MCTKLRNSRYMQYLGALTATFSNAAAAMYTVWSSPSMSKLQSEDSPVGRPISDEEGSWVVSSHKLAIIFSTPLGAWLVEKIGRKYSLIIAGFFLFFPWFMIIFGTNIWLLYAGRFIAGIGAGIIIIGCSIYNGEIAENDIRGKLGSTLVILKLVGSLIVLCIGPYVSYTVLGIVSAIFPILFISIFSFMPESPYHLMRANKPEKAEKNLRTLSSKLVDDKFIMRRMDEIESCIKEDMQNKTTFWEFLSNKEYRKAIIIIIGIKTLQQFSGEAAIDGYMQPIIESTNSDISSELSSIIFGVIQLPAVLTASFLVDKLGRKPLLIISALGCGVASFAEGVFFYFQYELKADTSSIAWLPTAGIAVFVVMNSLGIITLPYVLLGELFPTNIKGIAVSAATCYGAILAFIVSKFFKPIANIWGMHSVFWFFACVCVLGAIFVFVTLPETKGKTFAEIQIALHKDKRNKIDKKLLR